MAFKSNEPDSGAHSWQLGQVIELGTSIEPIAIGSVPSDVKFSTDILTRLLDLRGGLIEEVTWVFSHEHRDGPIRLLAIVTSRTFRGEQVLIDLSLAAIAHDGATLLHGECVIAYSEGNDVRSKSIRAPAISFVNEEWIAAIVDRLCEDPRFSHAASTYDGSIGLRFGRTSLGLRVYRGKVIDQGRAIFNDATFRISSPTRVWLEFARRPRNEFISFAMADRFSVTGSAYEYLRLTTAVIVITDHVRDLIRAELGTN